MVVQKTIHALRQRPPEDRATVAVTLSGAVMIILFLAWVTFFFQSIAASQVSSAQ